MEYNLTQMDSDEEREELVRIDARFCINHARPDATLGEVRQAVRAWHAHGLEINDAGDARRCLVGAGLLI